MALKVHNTLTRSQVEFRSLEEGKARVYACGPTIYDYPHIGNYRSFLFYDLVHRYLEWSGYEVRFVMNLTDVDDRTIAGAVRDGVQLTDYTRPYGDAFQGDARILGIRPVDSYPRATEYVEAMVAFIQRLEASGHAYLADDGAVYFSISKFPDYGKLKGIDLSTLRTGARVAHDNYDKEDARDFALWKAATEDDETAGAAWDSPWGRGRPGWHLECSVMSVTELGDTLDIHLGGEDLVFPHHENEIAQSRCLQDGPFVNLWLHSEHLIVDGKKMSKSLGNFYTLRDLLDKGLDPIAIRYTLLGTHYRQKLNFTEERVAESRKAVNRLLELVRRLSAIPDGTEGESVEPPDDQFRIALDDDLNIAQALGALFGWAHNLFSSLDAGRLSYASARAGLAALKRYDQVLGVLFVKGETGLEEEIEALIKERTHARDTRDWARADQIRDDLLRSEEHTSELQSHSFISYAVFCLKKKK